MLKKILPPAVLMLFAIVPFSSAVAVEQAISCRLKGGSIVQLAAETCAMEGGAPSADAASVAVPVAPAFAATAQFSADPKLAAAQRVVAELLIKPVIDKDIKKRIPEQIERSVQFEGCRLMVDENMNVEYGRFISSRKNFKVSSTIDLRNVSRDALGVLGEVTSYGGGMQVYAVYAEERKQREGNNIAISMLEQKADSARKYYLLVSGAYWDAPQDDFWMADEYGYPKGNGMDGAATDKVRILFS